MMVRIFGIVCVLALVCGVCFGDIIVDQGGGGDHTTIQTAINAAGTGDVVVVEPGTYVENINLSGRSITLRSTDPYNPSVVAMTIIDGGSSGSVITCSNGEGPDTVIEGFRITNGSASNGGGLYIRNSSPTINYCVFRETSG